MQTSRISTVVLIIFALFAGIAGNAAAQQTRVAYIDAAKLLKRMPEAIDAKTRLDQLTQAWTKEASDMQSEIDRKQADFDRRKLIMTDAERSATELDLSNLRKQHEDYMHQKFDADGGELFQQEAQLMKPAYDKLTEAIKEVAADGNYDYVIDRSSKDVVLLYTNSKFDLTLPVARKLGIESEILSTPLVSKPGAPLVPGQPKNPNQPNGQTPNSTFPQNTGHTPNQPTQPGFNSGGYNPNQFPQPVQKPEIGH
ncbi:MAG TPA: OmpH family outer membrane protein [Candidatus Kapabacteria bacterium]|nr:OmpH family outer membrane protein [Candidatus Kapabacteria bacterium]